MPAPYDFITKAIKYIKCETPRPVGGTRGCAPGHAGPDSTSRPILDSGFRRNDGFAVYCCRSNNEGQSPYLPPYFQSD